MIKPRPTMIIIILPFFVSFAACGQLNPRGGGENVLPSPPVSPTESLLEGYSLRHFLDNSTGCKTTAFLR